MYEKLYFGSSGSAKPFARGLRKKMTEAEAILWEALRDRRLKGLKFRRQHVTEGYIADFYCLEKGVVVEVAVVIIWKVNNESTMKTEPSG